jgi:hypothetical protein
MLIRAGLVLMAVLMAAPRASTVEMLEAVPFETTTLAPFGRTVVRYSPDQRYRLRFVATSGTCVDTEVQALITAAAAGGGGTVTLPACAATWNDLVTIPNTAGITLQGAGIGQTVITTGVLSGNHRILKVTLAPGNSLTRVTGITFNHNEAVCSGFCAPVLVIGYGVDAFRIDHNHFTGLHKRGMVITASTSTVDNTGNGAELSGLVDYNTFECSDVETGCDGLDIIASPTWNPASTLAQNVTAGWGQPYDVTRPIVWGSNDRIYVENNTFEYGTVPQNGAMDIYGGARLGYRFNTTNGTACVGWHGFDSSAYRGMHSFEVYGNTCNLSEDEANCMHWRSGSGFIFDNTCEHPSDVKGIAMATYRARPNMFVTSVDNSILRCDGSSILDGNTGTGGNIPANPTFTGWNPTTNAVCASCTVTFYEPGTLNLATIYTTTDRNVAQSNPLTLDKNGEGTVWLGLSSTYDVVLKKPDTTTIWTQEDVSGAEPLGNSGWPCLDQPGHIFDEDGGDYTTVGSYVFNNSDGVGGQLEISTETPFSNLLRFMAADRDYYLYTASFDGTSGVGRGVRASRPAAGVSVNGVGYWSTDQGGNWNTTNGSANDGCMDKMVAGAWVDCFYTPYTYPHPLSQ